MNSDGRFGAWACDVTLAPSEAETIIHRHTRLEVAARGAARYPSCLKKAGSRQEIRRLFGFRNMNGITRPQSWCRKCRGRHAS